MKTLDVHLNYEDTKSLNMTHDHIFIIRNESEHIVGRREMQFDYDVSVPEILNKCAEFTDADVIHCKIYNSQSIDIQTIPDMGYFDVFTYEMKVDDIDVCSEIFIDAKTLKNNRFNETYGFLFINEYKDRFPNLRYGHSSCSFPINETKNQFIHLEYELLLINNELKNTKKKYVIYTFSNSERQLPRINLKNENFNYVCFTENLMKDVDCWKMFNTSFDKTTIKICPDYFFKNYEMSIWIDNDVTILSDLNEYVKLLNNDNYILAVDNDRYDCVYDILKNEKDPNLCKFKVKLILDKYPIKNGLIDSYVLLRRHNAEECKEMMQEWIYDVDLFNVSDDLCFNYSLWKKHGRYLSIPFEIANQRFFGK